MLQIEKPQIIVEENDEKKANDWLLAFFIVDIDDQKCYNSY